MRDDAHSAQARGRARKEVLEPARDSGWSLDFTSRRRDPVTGEPNRWRHCGFATEEEALAEAARLRRPQRITFPFSAATKARLARGMARTVRIDVVKTGSRR